MPVELDGQLVAAALGPLPGQLSGLEQRRQLRLPVDCAVDPRPLDARRKVGILRALAGLGRHTKVIAFTHDPQVVALAQKAVDRDLLTVHELGGNEISGALQAQISTADVRPIRPAQAA